MRFAPRYMNFAHAGSRYLPFHSRLAPRLLALLLTSLAPLGAQMPPPAYDPAAQTAERQTREELDRVREQLRQQLPPARPPAIIDTAPPPQPVVQGDAVRRPIQDLQIVGASQMPEKFSAYLTSRYADRDLNASDVEQLLGEILRHYISRGYVTARAYLPPQDLSTGILRIQVVEGAIERFERGDGSEPRRRLRLAFPAEPGDVLNLRALEQGIDNLNRLPSNNARLDLVPGSEPGDTVVVVRNESGRRWRLSASAENTGSESTGREQVSLSLGVDDLLGLNDALSLSHRRSLPYESGRKGSEATTFSYALPWGYQSFNLGGSVSSYVLTVAAPSGQDLRFDGSSDSIFLRTDRLLWRNDRSRLNSHAQLTFRSTKSYLAGSLIEVSSRRTTVGELGATYDTTFAGAFVSIGAAAEFGMPWFGAAEDPSGLPDYAPQAEFVKGRMNAMVSRGFVVGGINLSFTSSLTAQYAPHVLYGADQLTVGGLYAVRGFDATNLAGDYGYVWRNELSSRHRIPLRGQGWPASMTLSPYIALDQGYAWSQVSGLPNYEPPEGSLAGGAIGLRINVERASLEVFHTASFDRPDSLPSESGRTYFRLNFSF